MHNFRTDLLTLGLMSLGLIFAVVNSHPVAAQNGGGDGKDVRVINTSANPVPTQAQGTTNVAGTVQSQQSGPWNVGIAGMPTFQVGNTAGNPVIVRDLDNPVREPFVKQLNMIIPAGSNFVTGQFSLPAGRRLVMEYLSAVADNTAAELFLSVNTSVRSPDGVITGSAGFTYFATRTTLNHFTLNQQTRLYAGPQTEVFFFANRTEDGANPITNECRVTVSVSGYLVDVP